MSLFAARARWSTIALLPLAAVCASCERTEPAATHAADSTREVRIVSLSPGITSTLAELGAADLLVGRTPWCIGAPSAPTVGTLLDIDAEALLRANPTLVFVQPPAQGIPTTLVDLAQVKGWSVVPIPLSTLADCRRAVADVAAACAPLCSSERREQIHEQSLRLSAAFDAVTAPIADAAGQRVLAVLCGEEGTDLLAFGTESYLMEVLQAQGFAPALERVGYQSLGQEDLRRVRPDIILLLGKRGVDAHFDALTARGTKVLRLNEPALLLPGGGITASLGRMRALLVSEVKAQ
ncbi:MAG: ABC transporter substrate-binding protein [Planctomycetota bacterium]